MSTKIWILHSVSHEDPMCYDGDFEARVFLGAHTSLERAKAFALRVMEEDAEQYNEELEEGEARLAPSAPEWREAYKDTANRPVLHSDTFEAFEAYHFEIVQSALDPTL